MYNPKFEPGFADMSNMPSPEHKQAPRPYPPSDIDFGPPIQQQPRQGPPMHHPGYAMQGSHTNTTVVVQQQPAQVVVQGPRPWATSLCSCFDDCGVCLLGWWCPCILQCMVSSKAGECCCVAAMCPIALRTKIRTRHNIAGSIMDDCCTLYHCGICALCQMARELNIHGI